MLLGARMATTCALLALMMCLSPVEALRPSEADLAISALGKTNAIKSTSDAKTEKWWWWLFSKNTEATVPMTASTVSTTAKPVQVVATAANMVSTTANIVQIVLVTANTAPTMARMAQETANTVPTSTTRPARWWLPGWTANTAQKAPSSTKRPARQWFKYNGTQRRFRTWLLNLSSSWTNLSETTQAQGRAISQAVRAFRSQAAATAANRTASELARVEAQWTNLTLAVARQAKKIKAVANITRAARDSKLQYIRQRMWKGLSPLEKASNVTRKSYQSIKNRMLMWRFRLTKQKHQLRSFTGSAAGKVANLTGALQNATDAARGQLLAESRRMRKDWANLTDNIISGMRKYWGRRKFWNATRTRA